MAKRKRVSVSVKKMDATTRGSNKNMSAASKTPKFPKAKMSTHPHAKSEHPTHTKNYVHQTNKGTSDMQDGLTMMPANSKRKKRSRKNG